MRNRILFLLVILLAAEAAFGAQGQREISLAGALTRTELEDFCEDDEPDCDDSFDSNLVVASYGYHVRDRIVVLGGFGHISQDNGGDSFSTTLLQPTIKYYLSDPDAKVRLYARGAVNLFLVDVDFDEEDEDDGSDDAFGFGLGLGVERDFDGPFLFVEVRYDDYSSFNSISIPFGIGIRF